MNRKNLTTAVIAGLAGVAGMANLANAVNLNPDGLGQVLLYPYYTVNGGQQTQISVVNTAAVGKVVKVRFLEGYNSREVLDFNLYLSPHDVWTANVFSLADAGIGPAGGFAGIFTTDKSCTDPALTASGTIPNLGVGYQQFLNFKYTGSANADTGPTTNDRTREGHFEMITMSDITVGSALGVATTHKQPQGVPPDCSSTTLETAVGRVAPTLSGLYGSASILNGTQGTFFAYNADAIDGFTYVDLYTTPGLLTPTLGQVNDPASLVTATSYVFVGGSLFTSTYPSADPNSRTIDAVSSLFDAQNVYNQYETSADGSVGTDWVVTFPTKRLYVDAQPGGAIAGATTVFPPFEELFGENNDGQSCITVGPGTIAYNREEGFAGVLTCPISPCPPGQTASTICLETNVIRFQSASILASGLPAQTGTTFGNNGWLNLDLSGLAHALPAATNNNIFHGLPVTGFEAVNFVNSNVSGGVLANYSGVYRHRIARNCTNVAGVCS